jgi:hypothetical protein
MKVYKKTLAIEQFLFFLLLNLATLTNSKVKMEELTLLICRRKRPIKIDNNHHLPLPMRRYLFINKGIKK